MSKSDIQYIFIPKASDDVEVARLLLELDKVPPHSVVGLAIDDSLINLEIYLPIMKIPHDTCVKLLARKNSDQMLEFRNILAAFTIIAQNPDQNNIIETCLGRLAIEYKEIDNTPCIKLEYYGTPFTPADQKPLTARIKELSKKKPMRYKDGGYIITPIDQSFKQIATMQIDESTLTITLHRGASRTLPHTLDCVIAAYPLEKVDDVRVIRTEFEKDFISPSDGVFCGVYRITSNDPITETDVDINSVFY